MKWQIKKLSNYVGIGKGNGPSRYEDAGVDLRAAITEKLTVFPGQREIIPTGISCAITPGWYLRVAPRSGLAVKSGIDVMAGVVDSNYRGEVCVILFNTSKEPFHVEPGDRIAQIIPTFTGTFGGIFVEELDETGRGELGFGSSGIK